MKVDWTRIAAFLETTALKDPTVEQCVWERQDVLEEAEMSQVLMLLFDLQTIQTSPSRIMQTNDGKYSFVNGVHRTTALRDVQAPYIPITWLQAEHYSQNTNKYLYLISELELIPDIPPNQFWKDLEHNLRTKTENTQPPKALGSLQRWRRNCR